jgi:hypothetical protein
MLLVVVAAFAGMLLTHQNTLAIIDLWPEGFRHQPLPAKLCGFIGWHENFAISSSSPRARSRYLVVGPSRRRPMVALAPCAVFAATDEFFQAFDPERTGSILDVLLDISGAVFAYFAYCALPASRASLRYRFGECLGRLPSSYSVVTRQTMERLNWYRAP